MRLKNSATYNFTTDFEILDGSNAWVEGFKGNLAPVDRFLSNFHRPLQRRMLHTDSSDALPTSRVIRNKATGEVYMLGQTRLDDENSEVYAKITVAQLISEGSSGLVEVKRLVVDGGRPASTIGELIDSSLGFFYVSVEYKTSVENFSADEVFDDRFLLFSPLPLALESYDTFTLNGENYKVNSKYTDSGYSCAILTRDPEERITGTYRRITSAYSTTTGAVTPTYDDYLATCTVSTTEDSVKRGQRHGNDSDVTIHIKTSTFPITPKVGNRFLADGELFKIVGVMQDKEALSQWELDCVRTNS